MATAAVFGGAAGLLLGGMVHGQGWVAVAVLVLVAGISALMSAVGATAAITGLQLLVYTILGTGPLGDAAALVVAAAADARRRGMGSGAAGARVGHRAARPGAAQHRRCLPRHRQRAPGRWHAAVPRGPSGRRHRAEPGLGPPLRPPGAEQRPGSGAEPHRRAAAPDPPAHRGGGHPGPRGRSGSCGAHRDDRRDRRRHRIRHAGDLSPPARRPDARQPGAGGRRGGSGRPGVGETARRGRGAAPAPAAAGACPGLTRRDRGRPSHPYLRGPADAVRRRRRPAQPGAPGPALLLGGTDRRDRPAPGLRLGVRPGAAARHRHRRRGRCSARSSSSSSRRGRCC